MSRCEFSYFIKKKHNEKKHEKTLGYKGNLITIDDGMVEKISLREAGLVSCGKRFRYQV